MVQLFTALLLGLLTILDPCTLMTSITAIGYIDKEINNKKLVLTNGLMFVLGKLATYVLLSIPFLAGLRPTVFNICWLIGANRYWQGSCSSAVWCCSSADTTTMSMITESANGSKTQTAKRAGSGRLYWVYSLRSLSVRIG